MSDFVQFHSEERPETYQSSKSPLTVRDCALWLGFCVCTPLPALVIAAPFHHACDRNTDANLQQLVHHFHLKCCHRAASVPASQTAWSLANTSWWGWKRQRGLRKALYAVFCSVWGSAGCAGGSKTFPALGMSKRSRLTEFWMQHAAFLFVCPEYKMSVFSLDQDSQDFNKIFIYINHQFTSRIQDVWTHPPFVIV